MVQARTNYRNYRDQSRLPRATDGIIFDLSKNNRMERLQNFEDLADDLTPEEESRLVDYVRSCFAMSHSVMEKRYSTWTEVDRAHDVYVDPDATDFREKAVISDTRAVADTVITYSMAAITGRTPMFQLHAESPQARKASMILERRLHRDLRKTGGEAKIHQHLLDSHRYGFAPTRITWDSKTKTNDVVSFDPRAAFPDPRVNASDVQAMQFMGFVSWGAFDGFARTGLYPKLMKYPVLREDRKPSSQGWACNKWHRERGRGFSIDPAEINQRGQTFSSWFQLGNARVMNELWFRLTGAEVGLDPSYELWMVCSILDEEIVARLTLNPYGASYPIVCGSLFQDVHKTLNQGLYDLILPVHNIATWLLRSRYDNVMAALNNLIFADPTRVNIPDLIDRNDHGIVRTLPGFKPGDGLYIAQVPDVTKGHLNDIGFLSDLKQRISAASDSQQGMPTADGIRTATEIQRLSQMGTQRLGTLARVMSATSIRPMVRMMVSNIQDMMASTAEEVMSYSGYLPMEERGVPEMLARQVQEGFLRYTIEDLQGDVEYTVVDGTLPSEPTRRPDVWLNTLQVMAQAGLDKEYDLGLIAEEAIRAGGIPDLERFRIDQASPPRPYMQALEQQRMQGNVGGPNSDPRNMRAPANSSVMPAEEVLKQVDRGNLVSRNQVANQSRQRGVQR